MSKEFPISEENLDAMAELPIDMALSLGDDVGALPRDEIAKRLKEMSRTERISKKIVASQALFESRIFIEAQKAFNLMAMAMDTSLPKSKRPGSESIAAAKQVIDIYNKRFPKVVDIKPQVIIDKKVYDIPRGDRAWFVRKGKLMHGATWKAAEQVHGGKQGENTGCVFNGGGPCTGMTGGGKRPVDVSALDVADRD